MDGGNFMSWQTRLYERRDSESRGRPIQAGQVNPARRQPRRLRMIAAQAHRILIVDELSKLRSPLCAVLADDGYACSRVESGSAARVVFETVQPHLVIFQCDFVDDSSARLLVAFRHRAVTLGAPLGIIVTSAEPAPAGFLELARPDLYLVRPFRMDDIERAAAALVRRCATCVDRGSRAAVF